MEQKRKTVKRVKNALSSFFPTRFFARLAPVGMSQRKESRMCMEHLCVKVLIKKNIFFPLCLKKRRKISLCTRHIFASINYVECLRWNSLAHFCAFFCTINCHSASSWDTVRIHNRVDDTSIFSLAIIFNRRRALRSFIPELPEHTHLVAVK